MSKPPLPPPPSPTSPAPRGPRILPPKYKHVIKTEWFRSFSWKERFKILFGYNLVVLVGIPTIHNPGSCSPIIIGELTDKLTASNYSRAGMESEIAKIMPPSTLTT